MNHKMSPLICLVLGIAYALEKIRLIVPEASPSLKAYLFSFESEKTQQHLDNLMMCIRKIPKADSWVSFCTLLHRQQNHAEEAEFLNYPRKYFTTVKHLGSEECFVSSCLNEEGRILGEGVYKEYAQAFNQIVLFLYEKKPTLGLEYDFGILFIQKDD